MLAGLSKNLVCCMPALIGGEDGEKVEGAEERRAVPSRVKHEATRMTGDERLIFVDQFLWLVKDHQPR